jgi:oxygen-independent coproporphyrinogen-3 oxidase
VIGLYVHVPYCTVRCSYCDFYLKPARGRDLQAYAGRVCREIETLDPALRGRAADTIHFGGGTPSLLPPGALRGVLQALRAAFRIRGDAEIGLEANPEDLDERRLAGLLETGVNRLAVGVQSLDDRLLALMRRSHGAAQALTAVAAARRAGVRSLGADLILGLPGQTPGGVLADATRLADLGVDHLSLYLLEVHDRTRLGRQVALGRQTVMPEDDAAALYERAGGLLEARGFEHYEISNFARPGHRSRHNLKYWTDQEYLGFGPSAHSYVQGRRWMNAPALEAYLAAGEAGFVRVEDPQPPAVRGAEALVAGLRIAEGVDLEDLRRRYGEALPAADDPAVADLIGAGLMERDGARLCLTRRGRLLSNEVCERLLSRAASIN